MKVTVMPIIAGAIETVEKDLEEIGGQEIRERIVTIHIC